MTTENLPAFDSVELGDEIGPLQKIVTDDDVIAFCEMWGNPGPNRFTEQSIAEQSHLPGPIVPGNMSMALMAQLLTDWAGPEAVRDLDLVFRQPVPHNQPLNIVATVTDTRQENGEDLVECDVLMTGTEGQRYVGGTAVVRLPTKSQ